MAAVEEKVEVSMDMKGNAAGVLEKVVALLEKGIEAEKKLQQETNRTNAIIERRTAPGTGGKSAAGGAGGGGFLQGMAGGGIVGGLVKGGLATQGIEAGLKVMGRAAEAATSSISIMTNSQLTNAQKSEQVTDALVPGAKKLRLFMEAITGVTEALRKEQVRHEKAIQSIEIEARMRQQVTAQGFGVGAAQGRAGAMMGTVQYAGQATFDRGTVAGEQQTADEAKRIEAADRITRAKREALGAATAAAIAKEQRDESQRKAAGTRYMELGPARERRERLERIENITGQQNKPGIKNALNREQEILIKLQKEEAQIQENVKREEQAILKLKEAQSQVRKAEIDASRAELAILKDKEQRMAQGQQRLGAMNKGQFELAKQAAKLVKDVGIENVTPEIIAAAQGAAPKWIAKQQEALGAGRAKEFAGLGLGDEFEQDFKDTTLKEIRAQVDKVQANVRVEVDLDEKTLAKEIATAMNDAFKMIKASLEEQARREKEQADIGRKLKNRPD